MIIVKSCKYQILVISLNNGVCSWTVSIKNSQVHDSDDYFNKLLHKYWLDNLAHNWKNDATPSNSFCFSFSVCLITQGTFTEKLRPVTSNHKWF